MAQADTRPAVLFVCLGNICRSPLAEAAFRAHMEEEGLDWLTDSAGTGAWHVGNPPDRRAQHVAMLNGHDISAYRGRQVSEADFHRFTHIFALDHDNLEVLREMAPPDGTASLGLLLNVVDEWSGEAVADPYYGGDDGFHTTWSQVDRAARALVEWLKD